MLGNIGTGELILIFLVILLVFGAKRIPEIARGLGKGIREFKDATREISRELHTDPYADRTRAPAQAPMPRMQTPPATVPPTAVPPTAASPQD